MMLTCLFCKCNLRRNFNGRGSRFFNESCKQYDKRYRNYYPAYISKCFYVRDGFRLEEKAEHHSAEVSTGTNNAAYQSYILFVDKGNNAIGGSISHFEKQR